MTLPRQSLGQLPHALAPFPFCLRADDLSHSVQARWATGARLVSQLFPLNKYSPPLIDGSTGKPSLSRYCTLGHTTLQHAYGP